jgi:hypothetical protein
MMLERLCLGVAIVLGLVAEANGLFMLYSPNDWYFAVPGVTTTGPFNQHFIRDIGLIFLFVGTAFLVGTSRPRFRLVLWATPTLWLWSHAVFHFWEVAVGICGPSVIARARWGQLRDSHAAGGCWCSLERFQEWCPLVRKTEQLWCQRRGRLGSAGRTT